jgi:hypothetical protein
VKEQVKQLHDAKFIRPCRYVDRIFNIVPVEKNGTKKLCVCIDFRDLNIATPKDEHPMPISDFLVNAASRHRIRSFLDPCYSQIFLTKEDHSKMTFICSGFVGLFEWAFVTLD